MYQPTESNAEITETNQTSERTTNITSDQSRAAMQRLRHYQNQYNQSIANANIYIHT